MECKYNSRVSTDKLKIMSNINVILISFTWLNIIIIFQIFV